MGKAADRHGIQGHGTGKLVVAVRMELGKMIDRGEADDHTGKWREGGFASCTGIHHAWLGFPKFREFVVTSGVRYTIVAMHMVGGSFALPDGKRANLNGCMRLSTGITFQ